MYVCMYVCNVDMYCICGGATGPVGPVLAGPLFKEIANWGWSAINNMIVNTVLKNHVNQQNIYTYNF